MYYVKYKVISEMVVSKSRFIGVLLPLLSLEELSSLLNDIKKEYPKASHYTYALITNNGNIERYHDDGEPSSTAGIHILKNIKQFHISFAVLFVIRYFGGTKLGANGLIRSYSKTSLLALKKATFYFKKEVQTYIVVIPYVLIDIFEKLVLSDGAILEKDFQEFVSYHFYLNDLKILDDIKNQFIYFEKNAIKTIDILK